MKGWLTVILLLFSFLPSVQAYELLPVTQRWSGVLKYDAVLVEIKKDKNGDYQSDFTIAYLNKGDKILVMAELDNWYLVDTGMSTSSVCKGWLYKGCITKIQQYREPPKDSLENKKSLVKKIDTPLNASLRKEGYYHFVILLLYQYFWLFFVVFLISTSFAFLHKSGAERSVYVALISIGFLLLLVGGCEGGLYNRIYIDQGGVPLGSLAKYKAKYKFGSVFCVPLFVVFHGFLLFYFSAFSVKVFTYFYILTERMTEEKSTNKQTKQAVVLSSKCYKCGESISMFAVRCQSCGASLEGELVSKPETGEDPVDTGELIDVAIAKAEEIILKKTSGVEVGTELEQLEETLKGFNNKFLFQIKRENERLRLKNEYVEQQHKLELNTANLATAGVEKYIELTRKLVGFRELLVKDEEAKKKLKDLRDGKSEEEKDLLKERKKELRKKRKERAISDEHEIQTIADKALRKHKEREKTIEVFDKEIEKKTQRKPLSELEKEVQEEVQKLEDAKQDALDRLGES